MDDVYPNTRADRSRILTVAFTVVPWAIWLGAHRSTLGWIEQSFTAAKSLNIALLLAVAAVLALGIFSRPGLNARHLPTFRLRPLPFVLVLVAALADQAARRLSSFDQLSVSLFVVGTYALLGCYMSGEVWRRSAPAALLLAIALPFGARFGTGLGYPARVVTAQWVESLLTAAGVTSISMHDVIVLENGVAHVDLPCSGLKSLWTGALFFLAATWIEGRGLGWRWLVGFGGHQLLLFFANATRVLLLVICGLVLGQERLASMLHVPLGVFGFLVSCAAGVLLLRLCPVVRRSAPQISMRPSIQPSKHVWNLAAWVALLLVAFTMPPLGGQPSMAAVSPSLSPVAPPDELDARPLTLTPAERQFFASKVGTEATKWRFEDGALRGSLLLVSTASWQTHHAPELCLASSGLEVEAMQPVTLGNGLAVHQLEIQQGSRSAVYWFQSQTTTTGSLLHRFWNDLVHGETRWVLVSVLFDGAPDIHGAAMKSLLQSLYQHVDAGLSSDFQEF